MNNFDLLSGITEIPEYHLKIYSEPLTKKQHLKNYLSNIKYFLQDFLYFSLFVFGQLLMWGGILIGLYKSGVFN